MKKYLKSGAIWFAGLSSLSVGIASLFPSFNAINMVAGLGLFGTILLVASGVSGAWLLVDHHSK